MLYDDNDTLSFEDVRSNLLSKKSFDLEVQSEDKGEGLNIRGRTQEKGVPLAENLGPNLGDLKPTKHVIIARNLGMIFLIVSS